jgi:hypothetical protein
MLAGCRGGGGAIVDRQPYPASLAHGPTLDIQVFRSSKHIALTNTTPRDFGPSTLWLNAWYSRDIDALAAGESLKLPLHDFRDRYSDSFRGGGFFATEKPDRLVLAELENEGTLYGLVVVGEDDE